MRRSVAVALLIVAVLLAGACAKTASSAQGGEKQRSASPAAVSGDLVPAVERQRMQALIAPYAYVPASLPRGFVYIDWKHADLTPSVAGQLLTIDFALPGGGQIVWTSSRACDTQGRIGPSATGYPGYGYGMTVNRSGVIAGRVVYFSQGNHGSNAWTCVPIETAWGVDYVAVGIWESNGITPQQAMQLVAYAIPA